MEINPSIFKSYDIRGVYPTEINEEAAKLIAQTYLKFISERLKKPIKELNLVLGRDIRESSEPLKRAVLEALLEYGVKITDLELISVNDLYFAVGHYKFAGGIMVTASHNPPEYGGFKMVFYNQPQNSIEVVSGKDLYFILKQLTFPLVGEKTPGRLCQKDISQKHLQHILSFVDIKKIKPFKIVADTGNGMNGILLPALLKALSCNLIHLFPELNGQFPNRPPNPLAEGAAEQISKKILAVKADFGAMFDADGDRMFLVDEKGALIKGDMTLVLLAKSILEKNPGAGIVYNLICSHAAPDLVKKWGGRPIRSEVGYINLSRHMREENGLMSGEVSGHFAFKENFYTDSGFIALALALQTISEDSRKLSEIIKDYSLYARGDEINLKVEDIPAKLDKIRNYYQKNIRDEMDGITVEFPNWSQTASDPERSRGGVEWWFNVRASNTEPLLRITVEAKNQEELKKKQEEVLNIISNDE